MYFKSMVNDIIFSMLISISSLLAHKNKINYVHLLHPLRSHFLVLGDFAMVVRDY